MDCYMEDMRDNEAIIDIQEMIDDLKNCNMTGKSEAELLVEAIKTGKIRHLKMEDK